MTYETNYFVLTVSEPDAANRICVLQETPSKTNFTVIVYQGDERPFQEDCNGLDELIETLKQVREEFS
jgi:hypothetical protein